MTVRRGDAGAPGRSAPGGAAPGAPCAGHDHHQGHHHDLGGESGAALVIALTMIAVVAVVLLALLSYTGTSLRAAGAVRTDRRTVYAADGAVEAAIQHVRNNPDLGYNVDEKGDPLPSCDFTMPASGDRPAVDVECTGQTASKRIGEGSVDSDQPLYSILTLGRRANQQPNLNDESSFWSTDSWFDFGGKGEVGLYYNPSLGIFGVGETPSDTAYLKGSVFSNSTIVASKGKLKIAQEPDGSPGGSFKVRQTCGVPDGGQILVEPSGVTPNCGPPIGYPAAGGGYGNDGQGVDPDYPSRIDMQGVPPLRSVPACDASEDIVKFEPGWYNDAVALTALTTNCRGSDGKGADFWFRPGLYYFDFRNPTNVNAPCSDNPRPHQWCIGEGKSNPRVLGGSPLASDGGEWVENPGIVNETRTIGFGTATTSKTAGVDDFANPANGRVIDNALSQATFGDRSDVLFRATGNGGNWDSNRDRAYAINGGTADGSNSAYSYNNGCTFGICGEGNNELWLNAYSSNPPFPPGGHVTNVTYRVRHREGGNLGRIQHLRMTLYDNNTAKCTVNLAKGTGTGEQTGDWTGCFTDSMLANGTARVLYEAKAGGCMGTCNWIGSGGGVDYWVDGVDLTVNLEDRGVRTLTLSSPSPTFPNPAIVTVGTATATVSHSEPVGSNPQLVVTAPSSPGCVINLPVRAANTGDTRSIMSCLGSDQAAALNGITIAYRAGGAASSTTLSLDGIRVVAETVTATQPERFRFPLGCDPEGPGVQFVFGGDSGIRVMDGTMNLCAGQPPGSPGQAGFTRQQIAYYGLEPLPALQASSVVAGGGGIYDVQNALVLLSLIHI